MTLTLTITNDDYTLLTSYVHRVCGIHLGTDKQYLIEQRLSPIARAHGCASFSAFARLVSCCDDARLRDQIITAITTNETSFFRDEHPFRMFREELLPTLATLASERKKKPFVRKGAKVSILSAGASTGQEAYSLSMLINDYCRYNPRLEIAPEDFSIVAADISSRALAKAVAGEYTDLEIQRGLTEAQRLQFFTRGDSVWTVKEDVRRIVAFRKANFVESFERLGGFDGIFCRNMLIYFDDPTKKRILEQFHRMLSPRGFLVLGSTENTYGLVTLFESRHMQKSVVYYKRASEQGVTRNWCAPGTPVA